MDHVIRKMDTVIKKMDTFLIIKLIKFLNMFISQLTLHICNKMFIDTLNIGNEFEKAA